MILLCLLIGSFICCLGFVEWLAQKGTILISQPLEKSAKQSRFRGHFVDVFRAQVLFCVSDVVSTCQCYFQPSAGFVAK